MSDTAPDQQPTAPNLEDAPLPAGILLGAMVVGVVMHNALNAPNGAVSAADFVAAAAVLLDTMRAVTVTPSNNATQTTEQRETGRHLDLETVFGIGMFAVYIYATIVSADTVRTNMAHGNIAGLGIAVPAAMYAAWRSYKELSAVDDHIGDLRRNATNRPTGES